MIGPAFWLQNAAAKWPQRESIRDQEVALTFRALYERAIQAAKWLHRRGKSGDRVVIALRFSVTSAIFYFGALYARMVAVPLDPLVRPSQLESMLRDIDPAIILGCSGLETKSITVGLYRLDSYRDFLGLVSRDTEERGLPVSGLDDAPSRLLNLVYTSGSTGQPKGVMLNGGNLEAVTAGIIKALDIGETKGIFTPLPFHHTYGLSQLWLMAKLGTSVAVVPDITNMAAARKMISEHRIDVIAGVPYHFAWLTRRFEKGRFDHIKLVTIAGAAPTRRLIERINESFPNSRINVMYGLTEASTRLTILPASDIHGKEGSIGLPIDGVELKIVDKNGNELGPHQRGELIARGANITPGYWKDRRLTRQRIVNGWLHTGDLAEKDEAGYYYYLGREDSVFKSGGEKIIPQPIEKVIREIKGVEGVVVFGMEDPYKDNAICAAVVRKKMSRVTAKDIISACHAKLDRLWVPHEVIFLEAFPETSTGKIKHNVLKEQISRLRTRVHEGESQESDCH
ncbi:MAG: class I adenylate-forming enzyme family protein [Thermodesulfobacteriota bacterium]